MPDFKISYMSCPGCLDSYYFQKYNYSNQIWEHYMIPQHNPFGKRNYVFSNLLHDIIFLKIQLFNTESRFITFEINGLREKKIAKINKINKITHKLLANLIPNP
jgi:hypothetical protein